MDLKPKECRDKHLRREDRLEAVEVGILFFVVVGVICDVLLVLVDLGWLNWLRHRL
jgi:hypothetical protein